MESFSPPVPGSPINEIQVDNLSTCTFSSSSVPGSPQLSEGSGRSGSRRRKSFTSPSPKSTLPERVSLWSRQHTGKLGIFYAKRYVKQQVVLSLIINGTVNDLTTEQKKYVEFVHKSLPFSVTFQHFYHKTDIVTTNIDRCAVEVENEKLKNKEENILPIIKLKAFIRGLRNLYKDMRDYKKNTTSYGGILISFFGCFADLCCLAVQYCNQSYQVVWENLYGVKVTSEPDIRLFKSGLDDEYSETMISVISQVKPGNTSDEPMGPSPKKKHQSNPRMSPIVFEAESSNADESEDSLELDLHDKVLGQHAGELLLELHFKYKGKAASEFDEDMCLNILGMIVEGTMVFFTVLEMTWRHYQKLKCNKALDGEDKATIYYTQPKEILNQEDREYLIADFMRLNNIELL